MTHLRKCNLSVWTVVIQTYKHHTASEYFFPQQNPQTSVQYQVSWNHEVTEKHSESEQKENLTITIYIFYSSQWEIKAVFWLHNDKHISIIIHHEPHAHTLLESDTALTIILRSALTLFSNIILSHQKMKGHELERRANKAAIYNVINHWWFSLALVQAKINILCKYCNCYNVRVHSLKKKFHLTHL